MTDEPAEIVIKTRQRNFPKFLTIILLGIFFFSALAIVLFQLYVQYIQSENREIVEQYIKKGKNMERQEDKYLIRGVLGKLERSKVQIWLGADLNLDKREVALEKETLYGCIPRYYKDSKGNMIDRAYVWVNMSNYTLPSDKVSKSKWMRTRSWFEKNVYKGDVVEVWFYREGIVRHPYVLFTIKNECNP